MQQGVLRALLNLGIHSSLGSWAKAMQHAAISGPPALCSPVSRPPLLLLLAHPLAQCKRARRAEPAGGGSGGRPVRPLLWHTIRRRAPALRLERIKQPCMASWAADKQWERLATSGVLLSRKTGLNWGFNSIASYETADESAGTQMRKRNVGQLLAPAEPLARPSIYFLKGRPCRMC